MQVQLGVDTVIDIEEGGNEVYEHSIVHPKSDNL